MSLSRSRIQSRLSTKSGPRLFEMVIQLVWILALCWKLSGFYWRILYIYSFLQSIQSLHVFATVPLGRQARSFRDALDRSFWLNSVTLNPPVARFNANKKHIQHIKRKTPHSFYIPKVPETQPQPPDCQATIVRIAATLPVNTTPTLLGSGPTPQKTPETFQDSEVWVSPKSPNTVSRLSVLISVGNQDHLLPRIVSKCHLQEIGECWRIGSQTMRSITR